MGAPVRRRGETRAKPARTALEVIGVRVALFTVAVALLAKILAPGAQAAHAGQDPRAASAALSRVLGAPLMICVQDEGAPPDSAARHDACALCRLADPSQPPVPASLVSPSGAPLPGADRLVLLAESWSPSESLGLFFARGPPPRFDRTNPSSIGSGEA